MKKTISSSCHVIPCGLWVLVPYFSLCGMLFITADKVFRTTTSIGVPKLDWLLDGSLKVGLTHLFYGSRLLRDDLLRFAVQCQLLEEGGFNGPCIMIDSNNIIRTDRLTDIAFELGIEVEDAMGNMFISRAFNSSQTYDLVVNHLDDLFRQVPARLLILPGFPNLYHKEGLTAEGMQQIAYMANRLMVFTLRHEIVTVVSAMLTGRRGRTPAGERTLATCAQIHVVVEKTPMRINYSLVKRRHFRSRER